MLHLIYSRIARARRRYYRQRPHVRRRLEAPVISIGNLSVGGSGKTPLAAEIARLLIQMGERPAILSRGYARLRPSDGVVVVSDGKQVVASVEDSGDEPLMLARAVPEAAVVVCASRYLAGRFAESQLNCTVHVLDDGFQHFDLMRDVDLLIAPDGSEDSRTLPAGRFREPWDAAADADALLIEEGPAKPSDDVRQLVPVSFTFSRRVNAPTPGVPAFAFAGIARPERFYGDLERAGWQLAGRRSFGDHHHYSRGDIEAISRAAGEAGARVLVTTEKDAVRVKGAAPTALPIVVVPLEISVDPAFREWLQQQLREIRAR